MLKFKNMGIFIMVFLFLNSRVFAESAECYTMDYHTKMGKDYQRFEKAQAKEALIFMYANKGELYYEKNDKGEVVAYVVEYPYMEIESNGIGCENKL